MSYDEAPLAPDAPVFASLPEEVRLEESQAEHADDTVASLVDHPGWIELRQLIEAKIADHRYMLHEDLKGKSVYQVGEHFLVASLVAETLESILQEVDSRYAARNERRSH